MDAAAAPPSRDWSNDLVLGTLQEIDGPIGDLVRSFPGRPSSDHEWLKVWFLGLIKEIAEGRSLDLKKALESAVAAGEVEILAKPPVQASVRVRSIQPVHFRGFRSLQDPIQIESDLVVFDGRNSTGKTSISEAVEWVITGQLSRRTSGQHGHPAELADCIANEFRPRGEKTFVEMSLEVDGDLLVVRRELKQDYPPSGSGLPVSVLSVNGAPVSAHDEAVLFDRIMAGVHPILMQHNLRRFVHAHPADRHRYFERLLQVDELTALIERAVIGPAGMKQFENPHGGAGLQALRTLTDEMASNPSDEVKRQSRRLRKVASGDPELGERLVESAKACFGSDLEGAATVAQCQIRIEEAQRVQRQMRLPLLGPLERSRSRPVPSFDGIENGIDRLRLALRNAQTARDAGAAIANAQQQVARATERLIEAGLIDQTESNVQQCPICEEVSLRPSRIREIASWTPLVSAIQDAERALRDEQLKLDQELEKLVSGLSAAVPEAIAEEEVADQIDTAPQAVRAVARAAVESAVRLRSRSGQVVAWGERMRKAVSSSNLTVEDLQRLRDALQLEAETLGPAFAAHRADVIKLSDAVGAAAHDDAQYRLGDRWLRAATLQTEIVEDVAWESAKTAAQGQLNELRQGFIELRGAVIEDARQILSEEMTTVWRLLRGTSGTRFERLFVPAPSGRGFKLEFALKAAIADGESEREVDALRVFSESQINAVGIAAYITRAKRLGHRVLIFDDPVQSMDEEHYRSFAAKVLSVLLEKGYQVVLLTHSETFARLVHEHHYMRDSFATLKTRDSKRKGCWVEEGSRRVTERLKRAKRLAEEGDLEGAWRLIRLAIERMYTLVKINEDPTFNSGSWHSHPAEAMWNDGVGEAIERAVPGAGNRLKEILDDTAVGAHDKHARSRTDIEDAIDVLRKLLNPLRLGSG